MSKHSAQMYSTVLHDIQCMSIEELEDAYDLQVDADGVVWDFCEQEEFADIHEWAAFVQEQERQEQQLFAPRYRTRFSEDDY